MPSMLTWIDHDSKARERSLRILSLFKEKDTRDELGLGGIRDSFADALFPGTSTIQTRLRYMLFVPWIYSILEKRQVPSSRFAREADRQERELIDPLKNSGDTNGVIGISAGKSIKRLPSSVYWAGLRQWGILQSDYSQDQYHSHIDVIYKKRKDNAEIKKEYASNEDYYDPKLDEAVSSWHPKLPAVPERFPEIASFRLTHDEASFLLDRIKFTHADSLLSYLSSLGDTLEGIDYPWEHPRFSSFSNEHQELLRHACLFSQVMHGASIMYNIELSRRVEKESKRSSKLDDYLVLFKEWIDSLPYYQIKKWSIDRMWELTENQGHTITYQTKRFVNEWISHIFKQAGRLENNDEAIDLIQSREKKLKGPRSRFSNIRALEQWGGKSGIEPFSYRWRNVKTLLRDLHQGLKEGNL